jgi:hypothetical protein
MSLVDEIPEYAMLSFASSGPKISPAGLGALLA